jgi:hypothetical protein
MAFPVKEVNTEVMSTNDSRRGAVVQRVGRQAQRDLASSTSRNYFVTHGVAKQVHGVCYPLLRMRPLSISNAEGFSCYFLRERRI